MTETNFDASLAFTLGEEGGWSDNPRDPGRATMKGVTFATFLCWYPGASVDDLRAITDDQVKTIYRRGYWLPVHGDNLPSGVDLSVFDFGVNAGPDRSIRELQHALGVASDGVLGPISMAALTKASPSEVIAKLAGMQKSYYMSLPEFDEFGDGWLARTERRAKAAMGVV